MRKIATRILAAAALFGAAPLPAAPEPRILEVPATAAWQHAASGMILPATAAGLSRGGIVDRTTGEQDVSADYGGEEGLTTTVFLFQTLLPDTAIWTDRALAAILLRPDFGLDPGAAPTPAPFRRPGAAAASGLRATLKLGAGGLTSTAVAVTRIGNWVVKIRMTSSRLDAAALDARLTAFVEALRWPAEAKPAPAAAAMAACPDSLTFKKAKTVRDDMADVLMNAVIGSVEAEQVEEGKAEAAIYCREPGPLRPHGVYRPNRSRGAYVIALGDAGRALRLAPALTLDMFSGGSAGKRVAMTLLDGNTTAVLPSFNRLPSPEQAMAVAFSGGNGPTLSVTTSPGKPD